MWLAARGRRTQTPGHIATREGSAEASQNASERPARPEARVAMGSKQQDRSATAALRGRTVSWKAPQPGFGKPQTDYLFAKPVCTYLSVGVWLRARRGPGHGSDKPGSRNSSGGEPASSR